MRSADDELRDRGLSVAGHKAFDTTVEWWGELLDVIGQPHARSLPRTRPSTWPSPRRRRRCPRRTPRRLNSPGDAAVGRNVRSVEGGSAFATAFRSAPRHGLARAPPPDRRAPRARLAPLASPCRSVLTSRNATCRGSPQFLRRSGDALRSPVRQWADRRTRHCTNTSAYDANCARIGSPPRETISEPTVTSLHNRAHRGGRRSRRRPPTHDQHDLTAQYGQRTATGCLSASWRSAPGPPGPKICPAAERRVKVSEVAEMAAFYPVLETRPRAPGSGHDVFDRIPFRTTENWGVAARPVPRRRQCPGGCRAGRAPLLPG